MTKSKVIAIVVEWNPPDVVVTFYRYGLSKRESHGYSDWMQTHKLLTDSSGHRIARLMAGGDVFMYPDRLWVSKRTDAEWWAKWGGAAP